MRPLRIEMLPPRPLPWWTAGVAAALALAAVGSLAAAGWRWQALQSLQSLQVQVQASRQQRLALAAVAAPSASARVDAAPYDADARTACKEAQFATAAALRALEAVALPGVTPVALALQADTRMARVELEVQDQDALLNYLAQLNEGEDVPRWRLLRMGTRGAANGAGMAQLEASW